MMQYCLFSFHCIVFIYRYVFLVAFNLHISDTCLLYPVVSSYFSIT